MTCSILHYILQLKSNWWLKLFSYRVVACMLTLLTYFCDHGCDSYFWKSLYGSFLKGKKILSLSVYKEFWQDGPAGWWILELTFGPKDGYNVV